MKTKYIVDLSEVRLSDLELVGGKNASLGEMIQKLGKLGVSIPGGFALTVDAQFLVEEGIDTISVTPDSMLKTIKAIHKIETKKIIS